MKNKIISLLIIALMIASSIGMLNAVTPHDIREFYISDVKGGILTYSSTPTFNFGDDEKANILNKSGLFEVKYINQQSETWVDKYGIKHGTFCSPYWEFKPVNVGNVTLYKNYTNVNTGRPIECIFHIRVISCKEIRPEIIECDGDINKTVVIKGNVTDHNTNEGLSNQKIKISVFNYKACKGEYNVTTNDKGEYEIVYQPDDWGQYTIGYENMNDCNYSPIKTLRNPYNSGDRNSFYIN
jgi:hypothetical protein